MATAKPGHFKPPLAEMNLALAEAQNWRTDEDAAEVPVFLASQNVLGSVLVRYLDVSHRQAGDTVQINFTGSDQKLLRTWRC